MSLVDVLYVKDPDPDPKHCRKVYGRKSRFKKIKVGKKLSCRELYTSLKPGEGATIHEDG